MPEDHPIRPPLRNPISWQIPDHHIASIRCTNCAATWLAAYKNGVNPNRLRCPECDEFNSEIDRYIRRIYTQ